MLLKRVVMAVVCAGVLSVAAQVFADVTPKYYVDHKGNVICVDEDSVDSHLAHGDTTDWEVCG